MVLWWIGNILLLVVIAPVLVAEALAETDRTVAAVAAGAARYGGSVAKLLPPADDKEA
jgi:hypothetical protein